MATTNPVSGRAIARRVLVRVLQEDGYLALALDSEFQRAAVPERERNLATEICYGVCRHLTRLDRAITKASARGKVKAKLPVRVALRVGAYQLLFLDRVPAHAAVDDAVAAVKRLAGRQMGAFVNGVLRRLAEQGEARWTGPEDGPETAPERALEHACERYSTPAWIARRVLHACPDVAEFLAAMEALNERAPLCLRAVAERTSADDLVTILHQERPQARIERTPYAHDALLVHGLGDPARSPAFARGLFTVQDLGAQLVTHLLVAPGPSGPPAPAEGEPLAVLDGCAGVGGKSTHLAELLGRDAPITIDAVDISAAKLALLASAAERLGLAERVRAAVVDLADPDAPLPRDAYDLVCLDAPCTGLGVLRRHPEAKWRVREDSIAELAAIQRSLLDRVASVVRPGGLLVYCVCTFTREEGPDQVAAFLERHPDFAREAPAYTDARSWDELAADPARGAAEITTWPHRHGADAFYAARLRRRPS